MVNFFKKRTTETEAAPYSQWLSFFLLLPSSCSPAPLLTHSICFLITAACLCPPFLLTLLFSNTVILVSQLLYSETLKEEFYSIYILQPATQIICWLIKPIERATLGSGTHPWPNQLWRPSSCGMQIIVTAHSAEPESMAGNDQQLWYTSPKFKSVSFYHIQEKSRVW